MSTKVLDHGYVKFIEQWGSDSRIIEAARMSTDKGFTGWGPKCPDCKHNVVSGEPRCANCGSASTRVPGDEKLLAYLYTHKHMTPFEMAGMTIEVQAPIFVFREWHRHRTQSYNEMSARYTPIPNVNYVPTVERLQMVDVKNKQAQSTGARLESHQAEIFRERLSHEYTIQEEIYQEALDDGVPKELARLVLPVARYSRMRASANLRNWLGFLTLRMDPAAQWEIRQFANAVGEEIKLCFPRTWELFAAGQK